VATVPAFAERQSDQVSVARKRVQDHLRGFFPHEAKDREAIIVNTIETLRRGQRTPTWQALADGAEAYANWHVRMTVNAGKRRSLEVHARAVEVAEKLVEAVTAYYGYGATERQMLEEHLRDDPELLPLLANARALLEQIKRAPFEDAYNEPDEPGARYRAKAGRPWGAYVPTKKRLLQIGVKSARQQRALLVDGMGLNIKPRF
jgi:hypothetical protein